MAFTSTIKYEKLKIEIIKNTIFSSWTRKTSGKICVRPEKIYVSNVVQIAWIKYKQNGTIYFKYENGGKYLKNVKFINSIVIWLKFKKKIK